MHPSPKTSFESKKHLFGRMKALAIGAFALTILPIFACSSEQTHDEGTAPELIEVAPHFASGTGGLSVLPDSKACFEARQKIENAIIELEKVVAHGDSSTSGGTGVFDRDRIDRSCRNLRETAYFFTCGGHLGDYRLTDAALERYGELLIFCSTQWLSETTPLTNLQLQFGLTNEDDSQ